ncbi:MAG: hypothetical protein QXU32_01315 [Nitrososphaerales archaeon]
MSELDELLAFIRKAENNLVLLVSDNEIDLNSDNKSRIYALEVDTATRTAGGRSGGFGQRRFRKIYGFDCQDGTCKKILETHENLDQLDTGYVVRIPIRLIDGKEVMASCSIDSQLVRKYNEKFNV